MNSFIKLSAIAVIIAMGANFADGRGVQMLDDYESDNSGSHHHHHHPHHHHKATRGKYVMEHYDKDQEGEEFMLCISRDSRDAEESIETCKTSMEAPMGVKELGLGCMSIFDDELRPIKQGCWIHQKEDVIQQACQIGACIADPDGSGPHFCCCQGSLCNKNNIIGDFLAKKSANF